MNFTHQLNGFLQKVAVDDKLNPSHISLYLAAFQIWQTKKFQNPIFVSRQELMHISKISAKATYHKCINDLHNFGYFQYIPSYNPFKGSQIYMFNFQTATVLKNRPNRTKIRTSIEQVLSPYINNNNINNNINNISLLEKKVLEKNTSSKNDIVLKVSRKKIKLIEEPEINQEPESTKKQSIKTNKNNPPEIATVRSYFLEQNSSANEADKFYNYFQSIGWKVGGKTPMQDWHAAARSWLLNAPKYLRQTKPLLATQPLPGQLTTATSKNYAEPL